MMKTYFAPPERTAHHVINNQVKEVNESPIMDALLEVANGILVVLNEDRQIVALNHALLKMLDVPNIEDLLGMRMGESLGCIHAFKEAGGCGTSEYCRTCGVAIATMAAIENDIEKESICALVANRNDKVVDICFQIRAKPIIVDNKRWILFYAHDITKEQFWLNLDRVFFHDINNTLTALYGNAQILEMTTKDNPTVSEICKNIDRLVTEISVQRELSHHRDTTFEPQQTSISLHQVKKELDRTITGHKSSVGKNVTSSWPKNDIILTTNYMLLERVLKNMIINALEATDLKDGIRITVSHDTKGSSVRWEVWNRSHIPESIQQRVFQRNFSSKPGGGRGIGTYSMKLFGERYLGGQVSFTSSSEQGTTFVFTLPVNMK